MTELGLKRRGIKPGIEAKGLIDVRPNAIAIGPFTGSIEIWNKWASEPLVLPLCSTVTLDKWRWLRKYVTDLPSLKEIPLGKDELPLDKTTPLPQRGCNVELTKVMLRNGDTHWTLGFEAFGSLSTVENDVREVAEFLADRQPPWPAGAEPASYPLWLSKHAVKIPESLAGCCSLLDIDVAWGEMDAYGHVNNAVYSRYIESARIKYLSEIGWDKYESSTLPILGKLEVRFCRPIKFPARITVGTRPVDIGKSHIVIEHIIASKESGEAAAVGRSVIIPCDTSTGKKSGVPDEVSHRVGRQLQRG